MRVTLQERIGVIETNLEDLQSGLEAESRAIGSVQHEMLKVDDVLSRGIDAARLARSLVQKTRELRTCLEDQRGALRELRNNMSQLRHELREIMKG